MSYRSPQPPLLNRNQPLYLPKGSVRAVLALLVIAPVFLLALASNIVLSGDQFVGLVTLVLTAYFVDKAAQGR
jgi:hypothetical protein